MNINDVNIRSGHVVDAAMRVHSALGPGLLESVYAACLAYELRKRGFDVLTQHAIPVVYEQVRLEVGFRADLVVDDAVIVEVKAVTKVKPVHVAQLLSYLKLSDKRVGLLINFHVPHLKDGITRLVNGA